MLKIILTKLLKKTRLSVHFYSTEATFELKPFRLHRLETGPATQVTLTKPDALTIYDQMQTIRKMETAISKLYTAKAIRGFCHLYAGQEAVAVGVQYNVRPNDIIVTSYRNHAWTLLNSNLDPAPVVCELMGTTGGCSRGKGGSMHMYGKNFIGGSGIVGAHVPLGAGVAFTFKYKNEDRVAITVYGDGAANNGQVFEAFNMAKMWKLPCLFLCENNLFGMGTSVDRHAANKEFYTRGDYIPGVWTDGMDVLMVREAVKFAFNHCISGKGPIIIEAQTYRYFGHSMSDPGTSYRTHEEVKEMRSKRDPITNFKQKILDAKLVTEDELKEIENKRKKTVDDAVAKCKKDKEVGLEELTINIYSNDVYKEIRGVSPFSKLQHKVVKI
ncbi:pyruvate dehydrogenase E1 component subunit alpha, mitochondrial [Tribolium castaneum]|uniref:pyruvate dehydrogenase E1 component subunit alpha, mitochondrial n=1 Tax=Tribolium castaneum TaxID=7070 RepID=UPI0030FE305E